MITLHNNSRRANRYRCYVRDTAESDKFLLNIGSFVYSICWLVNPDVFRSLSSYLSRKVINNFRETGVYEIYLQSIPMIEKTMSRPVGSTIVDFNFENVRSEERLSYVVQQILLVLLNRIGRQTEYSGAAQNLADVREYVLDTQNIGEWFQKGTFTKNIYDTDTTNWVQQESFPKDDNAMRFPPEFNPVGSSRSQNSFYAQELESFTISQIILDEYSATEPSNFAWMAYVPMYQLMAMQCYMDRAIDITKKYPQFIFTLEEEEAFADDALYEAYNSAHIGKFSYQYEDFPVIFNNVEYYSIQEIRDQIERLTTVSRLLGEIKTIREGILERVRSARTSLNVAKTTDENNFVIRLVTFEIFFYQITSRCLRGLLVIMI